MYRTASRDPGLNTIITTLDRLRIGDTARIRCVEVNGDRGTQLMEMGLTAGTDVSIVRIAPLGDPINVFVRGYHLSLRRSEARQVAVVWDEKAP